MVPFIFMAASLGLLRAAGFLGVPSLQSWRVCARIALALMFFFTGGTHFTAMKHDYAAMIPPPIPAALWVVYLTGAAEIVAAAGLLTTSWRKPAAVGLIVLLLALFPANIHAALQDVSFGGRPPTALLPRALIQLAFIGLLWWSALREPPGPGNR